MKSLLMFVLIICFFGCSNDQSDQNIKVFEVSKEFFDLKDEKGSYRIDTVDVIFFGGGGPNPGWRCLSYRNDKRIEIIDVDGYRVDIFYDSLSTKKLWIKRYQMGPTSTNSEIHIRTIEDLRY